MKPIYYGGPEKVQTLLKPTKEIDVSRLERTADLIRKQSEDKLQHYVECVRVYNTLFKHGHIPIDQLDDFSEEILEIARDDIDEEMSNYIAKPCATSNMNYYYEYCRALSVSEQIHNLTDFLDEESDFI